MTGPNLLYAVPAVGDAGPGWATNIHDALGQIEVASDVSLEAYVRAAGLSFNGVDVLDVPIAAAIAAVPAGGVISVNSPGICRCSPTAWNTTKVFTLVGPKHAGQFAFWILPTADVASTGDAIFYMNPPPVTGSVRGKYGGGIKNVGIDMTGLTKAVGVKLGVNVGWGRIEELYTVGGYRGWDCRGANCKIDGFLVGDPIDCGFFIDDTATGGGPEIEVMNGVVQRNSTGTTTAYFKIILTTGGQKGDVKMHNVRGSGLPGQITNLAVITAPVLTDLPCLFEQVILDDAAGPLILTNISRFRFSDGWLNAAGGTSWAVIMDGCYNPKFRGSDFFGGTSGTFEFTGAVTDQFTSKDNHCPSGPVYWMPATNRPTNMHIDDEVPGASALSQITNDVAALSAAAGRLWGPRNFQDHVSISAVPAAGAPFIEVATLVAGVATISAPGVDAFYSQFVPFVFTPAGTTGVDLKVTAKNAGAGTITVQSRKGDGTVETADTSVVGVLRFDIPH